MIRPGIGARRILDDHGAVLTRNQFLPLLGEVPAWVKELSWGLIPFMLLMTIVALLLWRHRARSAMGRLYYTAQAIAGCPVTTSDKGTPRPSTNS